jgi:hypothetical protein
MNKFNTIKCKECFGSLSLFLFSHSFLFLKVPSILVYLVSCSYHHDYIDVYNYLADNSRSTCIVHSTNRMSVIETFLKLSHLRNFYFFHDTTSLHPESPVLRKRANHCRVRFLKLLIICNYS